MTTITLPTGETIAQPTGLYIGGGFIKSEETIETIDPASEEVITSVYIAGEKEIDLAVQAARKAFKSWKNTSGTERGRLLYKLADLLEEHADTVASIEALDSGKPKVNNAKGDIDGTVEYLRYCAGWADKIAGSIIPTESNKLGFFKKIPIGVCAQIVPWNYPLGMAGWKIAPALAAGNCIIIKSAETTPLSLLYVAQLVHDAGFPAGVVNVVSGLGSVAGAHMASHPDIDKVAFTGSTKVGSIIQELASKNMKAVTLECGGKSPLLVFEDADLDQAAKWSAMGVIHNSGQICTANSRIYVHESVYQEFLKTFTAHIKESYQLGHPFDDNSAVGPVVSKAQFDRVSKYIEIGKREGAKMVLGDEPIPFEKGYWIQPTVFADCTEDMTIVKEEIFGPVVAVSKFSTEEEVLAKANDSMYGLAAMCFTKDLERAHRVSDELEAGMVFVNSCENSDLSAPFGGVKMSGVGRELGQSGIDTYCQLKSYHFNIANKL